MTLPKYVPPTYNPPAYSFPAPKPVTPPAGYTIDGNGNLQLLPGYYTDNSGNAQPIPPVYNPPLPKQNSNMYISQNDVPPGNDAYITNQVVDPQTGLLTVTYTNGSTQTFGTPAEQSSNYNQAINPGPQNVAPGYSQDDIRAFVNANISDPAKIQQAMAQYGVDTNQIAQAMGVDQGTVTSYFNNYNQGPSQTAQPPVYTSTPQPNPAPQATSDNTGGVVPYQLPDGSTIMIPAGTLGAEPTPQ